jgi:hypothetical protein
VTAAGVTLVVPYRSARPSLERLLGALQGWRVLVVDDSDEGLDLDVPRVRLGGGRGFARAANAGLAAVRTPNAILLNDDTLPEGDCLDRLVRRGGLCGPVLVGPRGVESTGIELRSWGRVRQRVDVPDLDRPVAALSGACLHLPATARFDERFPHGGEDVELCRRLGGAWLVAGARCWHAGGATLDRRSPEATRKAVVGQVLLFPPGWRTAVVGALHVAQVLREGGPLARLPAVVAGLGDAHALRRAPGVG